MSRAKLRRDRRRHVRLVSENSPPKISPLTLLTPALEEVESPTPVRLRKPSSRQRQSPWPQKIGIYLLRLGIVGGGLAIVVGTVLTVLTPTKFLGSSASTSGGIKPQQLMRDLWSQKPIKPENPKVETATSQEIEPLQQKIALLSRASQPKITPYGYFLDVDTGQYINFGGDKPLPAASTIKIPIAIAFFEGVDKGKIRLDEPLPLTQSVVGQGSGDLQYQVGKKKSLTALETVTKMIVISDNTATNMIVQRLGGQATLNQRFQSWGLTQTQLKNPLPDLAGTNQTSAQDLVRVLFKVNQGEILSLKSRDRLLGIMEATKTKSLLPQGLEAGAIIAHKTGDIGTVLGDAGIVDMPTGKRYIGAVLATRPHNDLAARTLIQEISRTVYQHFKGITPPPQPQTTKAAQPTTSPPPPKVRKTPSADSTP